MENTLIIVAFAIISTVSYTWADCPVKFSSITETDKLPVTNSYTQSRDSTWERFKNMMKGRLVDPICTSKQDVAAIICECAGGKKGPKSDASKKPKKGDKDDKEESKESCSWKVLSRPDGTNLLKYANMFPCGDVYVTQGYAYYSGNVHDVFVVEEKKDGDVPSFVFKKVLKAVDFNELKEDNISFWNQLYLQGLSFIFNWDKHLS